ncbi:MAG: MOSC N-terminal beta barrel domain-containing protein [Actinomycetota bacterium]
MPVLTRLSIAPVKSLALHHPQEVALQHDGVRNDRLFYLADPQGRLVTGSAVGPLVRVSCAYDIERERLRLDFPDGTSVEGGATDLDEQLTTDFYGRDVPAHIVDGPFAAALSDYARRPVRLARVDRAGDGADVHHLTLVSSESVAELGRQAGREGDPDARRFRMLLEITGVTAHDEDTWDEREVAVGGAVIRIHGQVPRCVVTTQDPSTGLKDLDTLKTIARYREPIHDEDGRGLPFGVYGEVVTPATVRLGDQVVPH